MKFLVFSMLLFAARTFASGCDPYDVELIYEKPIVSIGTFEPRIFCRDGELYCQLHVYSQSKYEWHSLRILGPLKSKNMPANVELYVYEQLFESSCNKDTRYIIGTDIDGVRFRIEEDLELL